MENNSLELDYYRLLLDHSSDLIILCDVNNRVLACSASIERILGYHPVELKGKSISHIYSNSEDTLEVQVALMKSNEFRGVIQNVRKDGQKIHVQLSASSLFDVNGNVIGSMGISYEINRNHVDEIEFADIVENVGDVIYTSDFNGTIEYANTAFEILSGYNVSEVIGKNFINYIDEEWISEVNEFYRNHFSRKLSESYFEFKLKLKNGESIWVGQQVRTKYNRINPNIIDGFYGVIRNINERKYMELLLQKSEAKYRQLFDHSGDLIQSIDAKGNFLYVNNSWMTTLGYDYPEVSSMNLFDIIHPESLSHCDFLFNEIINTKVCPETNITYSVITKDGRNLILQGTVSITVDQDEVISIQSFLRDMTEITLANEKILDQNQNIQASIEYAKHIQNSMFPSPDEIKSYFEKYLLIYEPRDAIGGDFFVFDKVRDNDGVDYTIAILGDCTGHGVPGGVLSILCTGLLKETFVKETINTPAEALDYVRNGLVKLFRSNTDKYINDGMDAIFCVFDFAKMRLNYASANLMFYLVRDREVTDYKGDLQHVGYSSNPTPFKNYSIEIKKNDLIVLFSDGYVDQFGGENNRKFMRRRLHAILLENSTKNVDELKKVLMNELKNWQGDNEQTDDISVLAIRI